MSSPEKLEMQTGKSEVGLKRCKENEVKLSKPKLLKFSEVAGMEDGNIPELVLVELLIRLPVRSVFRFKLVSKQWLSIISYPAFIRAYVSRASLFPLQPWTLVSLYMLHRSSANARVFEYGMLEDMYLKPSLCEVPIPSIHPLQEERFMILGVSCGLLLYGLLRIAKDGGSFSCYICNPLTGQSIALPPTISEFMKFGWGFVTRVEDGFLKSYRVVLLQPPIHGSNCLTFQVYFSETGEWKNFIMTSNLEISVIVSMEVTTLNGILHWIIIAHGIIAYDPYENPETANTIDFPGDIDDPLAQDGCNSMCVAYKGKLRYFEASNVLISGTSFPIFRVWVLNDYNSGNWCLQHHISYSDIHYDANFPSTRRTISPRCFHPSDPDIVYLRCDDICVSYNIKTRKLQVEEEFFRHSGMHRQWSPSFLLVFPPWPISIARPSLGAVVD